jgi:hypothetical protein
MFSSDYTRWITNAIFAAPTAWGAVEVQRAADALKVSQQIPAEAVAALGFSGCALVVIGGVGIIFNELRNHEAWTLRLVPSTSKPTVEDRIRAEREPKAEPVILENGLRPIIKVDGKPRVAYAYTAQAMKINKEREFYVILWRWHESGREINLTEAYWLKQRKQFKRSEFVDVKARGEAGGILYRLSAAKNAPHDVHDWEAVERVARGGALPR